jgi:hypothetical protein
LCIEHEESGEWGNAVKASILVASDWLVRRRKAVSSDPDPG